MRSLYQSCRSLFSTSPISNKTTDMITSLQLIRDCVPDPALYFMTADLQENLKNPDVGPNGMSARQVLSMALIKQCLGLSYRDLHLRVEDSVGLRSFAGYEFTFVPQKSALQDNISAIRDETWEVINDAIVRYGIKEKIDSPDKLRIDTTNTQTDIHHPTDATLLFDGVRVVDRMCARAKQYWNLVAFPFHRRTRACKKCSYGIANAKSADKQKKLYLKLVPLAEETLEYGVQACRALRTSAFAKVADQAKACGYAEELQGICELLRQVIDQTKRRVFNGEAVPAEEKVVSIFEPHTNILEKGQRETEFGHKVCLTMGQKLIFYIEVLDGNPVDTESYIPPLKVMKKKFGKSAATTVATDQGFGSSKNALEAAELGVMTQSFTGRKIAEAGQEHVVKDGPLRRALDRFRAGAEGMISTAKRAGAGLKRCLWEGYDHFVAYVWSVATAFNVRAIARVLVERMAEARTRERPVRC